MSMFCKHSRFSRWLTGALAFIFLFSGQAFALGNRVLQMTASGYTGGTTLTNFPVLVRLSENINGFKYAACAPDGADLSFVDSDAQPVPYEIDTWNPEGESLIWVVLPEFNAETKFRMFYSDANAVQPDEAKNGTAWAQAGYAGVWHFSEMDEVGVSSDATPNHLDIKASKPSVSTVSADGLIGSCAFNTETGDRSTGFRTANYDNLVDGPTFTVSGWFRHGNTYSGYEPARVSRRK